MLSWRWIFGINIPLGLAVMAGVLVFVPESRDPDARRGVDWVGGLLSVAAAGLAVFALIEGRSLGWWAPLLPDLYGLAWPLPLSPVPIALAAAAVLVGVLLLNQRARRRAGRVLLIDLGLFAITSYRQGNLTAVIVALGEFGILFSLPLWFQNVLGYTALQTGVALLPLALASFVAGGAGAVLATRRGPVLTVRVGLGLEVLGVAGLAAVIAADTAWWVPVLPLALYGFGVGLATAQLPGVVLSDVPARAGGQASGTLNTAQQLGSALGVAVLGTVLFTSLGTGLTDRLAGGPLPPAAVPGVVAAVSGSAGGAIAGLAADPATQPVAEQARAALAQSTRNAAVVATGFLLLGLLASLRLKVGAGSSAPGSSGAVREPDASRARP